MKIRTRVLAGMATLALAGSMAVMAAPANASTITVSVHNATLTCDTMTGSLKFATPLTLGGPTTGASTTTIKAALSGCTSPQVNGGGSIFKGAATGTLTGNGGSACGGILGTSMSTGTLTIKWTAPHGYKFQEVQTINGHAGTYSQPVISQSAGATFTVPANDGSTPPVAQGPWAGTTYGEFQVGGPYGTTNIHDTGASDAFTGGDNGHGSWIDAVTNAGTVNLLGQCTSTGIKALTLGVGGTGAA